MFTALPITAQHTMERGVFDLQKVKFEYALGLFKSPVALISKHIKISFFFLFFFLLQLEAVLVKCYCCCYCTPVNYYALTPLNPIKSYE